MSGVSKGSVLISLPKDRHKHGTLVLRGPSGALLFSCHALGRSVGTPTNPSHDPVKFRGDTPLGKYALTHIVRLARPVTGIGILWCPLDPDDFYDTQARRAEIAGRRGLGMHGGRGDLVLKATHGCVRLRDRDMQDFERIAGKMRFTIEIVETA